jgi:beta-galactosidase
MTRPIGSSRRRFLSSMSALAAAGAARAATPEEVSAARETDAVSLNGIWQFRLESDREWGEVRVPHTWQVEPANTEYRGLALYRRMFDTPADWRSSVVRVEFEAVFHSATVAVNGEQAGSHIGKGYTAFAFDITRLLRFGSNNEILVRVDNSFNESMLPRGRSSDWAHDGGIYRPVQLLVTPAIYIERVDVDAEPAEGGATASLAVVVVARNAGASAWRGPIEFAVIDQSSGLTVLTNRSDATVELRAGETREFRLPDATIAKPRLWHFDHPHLYELSAAIGSHVFRATFGIRKIETRDGAFYLNGERVKLMGVERMAGSNPEFGMAEPSEWIDHDHADLKELNCVYTRVHWQQDRRVLDYCDRHGILIQTEVPTWGPKTFAGMTGKPADDIMQNGLEQLREMIARDRNHPSIFSWGVCNEIGGQNPPAYNFAKRMLEEAKRLDPKRLVTYASNSLQSTPEKDVSGLMDYIMWNEYYESWYKGGPADVSRNLELIHNAFPGKAIVISEYGYCACTPDRPEGDGKRIEVLSEHDRIFREHDYVAGLIFFCYNDYRTHIGDKGQGAAKQRVHGVVDLYGNRKPSFEALRNESSPVRELEVLGLPSALQVVLRTRDHAPAYTLRGYKLRAIVFGFGDIPLERIEASLPDLAPGARTTVPVAFSEKWPVRIQFDVLRPTGFSAYTKIWKP